MSAASETLLYPLSFAQQRLWFLDQMNPGDPSYNLPFAARIRGNLDVDALERSLAALVARHEVLRTRFVVVDGQPCQAVEPGAQLVLERSDLNVPTEDFERLVADHARRELAEAFVLGRAPLARARLLRNGSADAVLFLTMHHAISDGWSLMVLIREIAQLYVAFQTGAANPLAELPIQYGDFAVWQREQMAGPRLAEQLTYWRQRLRDAPVLDLPCDRVRRTAPSRKGAWHRFRIGSAPTESLSRAAAASGATPFMALLAAWNVLLRAYSGQDDICVGTPLANRQLREVEDVLGFFVSTLVLRTDLSENPRFDRLLADVRARALEAYAHQDVPFERLVEELRPERHLDRSPLFQVAFALQNTPMGPLVLPGLEITPIDVAMDTAKFDISCYLTPDAQGLSGVFEYSTDLFDAETMTRMANHFVNLVEAIGRDPGCRIDDYPFHGARERPRAGVARRRGEPKLGAILDGISARVAEAPDSLAVIAGEETLSFRELDARASQIETIIRRLGIGRGSRVVVSVQAPMWRAAAIVGTMRAGSSCLPLHPVRWPRLDGLVTAADVNLIVTDVGAELRLDGVATLLLGPDGANDVRVPEACSSAATASMDECLAGVALTPTGPRIAVVSQGAVSQRLGDFRASSNLVAAEVVACAPDDDGEILYVLACGATATLWTQVPVGPAREDVALACVPAASIEAWRQAAARGDLPALRAVLTSADVSRDVVRRWVDTTRAILIPRLALAEAVWYSQPQHGTVSTGDDGAIVDRQLRRVGEGAPGELVIRGGSLASGYLRDPAGTAERFAPDDGTGAGRLFRTGLRGRDDEDGRIRLFALPGWALGEAAVGVGTAKRGRAARSPLEELLLGLYTDVLGLSADGGGLHVDSNFFQSGGHSLLATLVVSRINEAMRIELPLRAIFEAPTVASLSERVADAIAVSVTSLPPAHIPVVARHLVPLSSAQQRLWLLDQLEPGRSTYNVPIALRLEGIVDLDALRGSLLEITRRHEVLRTRFVVEDTTPRQEIDEEWGGNLEVVDLSSLEAQAKERELDRRSRAEAARPFDLARGPLLRAGLVRLDEASHVLLVTMHHVVSDGWSIGVFIQELAEAYAAKREGRVPRLPAVALQYADFAAWQRRQIEGPLGERQLAYWRERLKGAANLELPTERPRPALQTFRGATYAFRLPLDLTRKLVTLGHQHDVTLFMTLFGAWCALLHRYSGQTDMCIGTPIANRQRAELQGLIGFFVNTLVLRVDVSGDPTFVDLLARVRDAALGAYAHQDLPFERVVEELNPERDLSRSPLFQVLFALQNAPTSSLVLPGLRVAATATPTETAKFDLSVSLTQDADGLAGVIEYATDLFDVANIRSVSAAFEALLTDAVRLPEMRVSALSVLSDADERTLLHDWNRTGRPFPADRCLQDLFAERVVAAPDAIAIADGGSTMTYRELDERAERLAGRLRRRGAGPEQLVAVCLERSSQMIVAMLAALKTGAGYVSLDPGYPPDRLAFMIDDAQVRVLITRREWAQMVTAGPEILCIDQPDEDESSPWRASSPASAENVAYLLYTSGSTGRPKGIAITHRSINRMIFSDCADIGPSDRVAHVSNASFDAAPYEIWGALTTGAQLVIIPRETVLSPPDLAAHLARERVTFLQLTTALFNMMAREVGDGLRGVRHLFFGGEAADLVSVKRVLSGAPPARLINGYGPAESTTIATAAVLDAESVTTSVPIGTPIANTQVYLLDSNQRLVPRGAIGEIYIAGDGLARGYWRRAALTAERFLPCPFGPPGARMYRTGDLARLRSDGLLEFIGRLDDQVKIRGHRIEPREVRAVLCEDPRVTDAVVWAEPQDDGQLALRACVASTVGLDEVEVRRHLRARLPAYLVPSAIAVVDRLPLTPNGKVDRARLPAIGGTSQPIHELRRRTATEALVEAAWKEVLGGDGYGADENFFEAGGHSLLAARVRTRVAEWAGVELPLRTIFEAPTLSGLAARVDEALRERGDGGKDQTMGRAERSGSVPLSYGQQRLWVLDQMEPGQPTYNIPVALELIGEVDVLALCAAVTEVVERHEVLRTRFVAEGGEPRQQIDARWEGQVLVEGMEAEGADALRRIVNEEAQRGFELSTGDVFRVRLVRAGVQRWLLLMTMHHIVSDGWSMGILVEELGTLYAAKRGGAEGGLPELPVQYGDFAVWQRRQLEGETGERQLTYWREQLKDVATLELPTDRARPAVQSHRGQTYSFEVPEEVGQAVVELGRHHDGTPFMTLLAAWCVLLGRYSGQRDICVGTPIANRHRKEIEGLIGFFVNTLVMRADLSGDPTFAQLLARVREAALGAYAHQDLPFERIVEALNPERDLSRSPLFQVMFMMQEEATTAPSLPGIEVRSLSPQTGRAKFDLTLSMVRSGTGKISGTLEYATDLFDEATIARMAGQLVVLLRGIVAEPERGIWAVPVLGEEERRQQLYDWNATTIDARRTPAVHEMILAQAARRPAALAVKAGDRFVTYGELVVWARGTAAKLLKAGVKAEAPVAIVVERSIEMVVASLGALMAGAAYLPIEPGFPDERMRYVLDRSGTRVVLARGKSPAAGWPSSIEVLDVGEPDGVGTEKLPTVVPQQLAYVIYTSGSTGEPKGVAVTHGGLTNYLLWAREAYRVDEGTHSLVHSSLGFDLTVTSLWCPLAAGGVVELLDAAEPVEDLLRAMRAPGGPRLLKITPAHLSVLADAVGADVLRRRSDTVVIGGEALASQAVAPWLGPGSRPRLINEYGPTETVVGCCIHEADEAALAHAEVPIGKPIANTALYVLDERLEPVPVGAVGELFISGAGLARGYVPRPDLTALQFVPNPFGVPGARMYRTGDLAKYRADGTLVFVGRRDNQVKLRGFRIELGEIEAALKTHPQVKDAAVLLLRDATGAAGLRAFLANAPVDEHHPPPNLQLFLQHRLPDYMIPSSFAFLTALPLTANGKVDRDALARMAPPAQEVSSRRVPPRTDTERQMAELWQEVLGVPVGVTDDFFEAGGTSLKALRLVSAIERRFGRSVRLADMFTTRTIAALTAALDGPLAKETSSLVTLTPAVAGAASVFCAHPVGGSVDVYTSFARTLAPHRGCFGLQAVDADGDVRSMAGRYIREIRMAQPQGPYFLCGWSFGGVLAFEITQQLTSAGDVVESLVLVDPATVERGRTNSRAELLRDFAHSWRLLEPMLAAATVAADTNASVEEALEALIVSARRKGLIGKDISMAQIKSRFEVFVANRGALGAYRPVPYRRPGVTVFWAAGCSASHAAGWRRLVEPTTEIVLDADHYELLAPPHVERLAALFAPASIAKLVAASGS